MAMRRWRPVPAAVIASARVTASASGAGRRSRRPITSRRTRSAASRGAPRARYGENSRNSVLTSVAGRFQLSAENAYSVRAPTPSPGAARTMRRTVSAPERWPAARGRRRRVAQRPLPSMTMATCSEVLCVIKFLPKKREMSPARRADQRFQMIEIALQRPPALSREAVLGAWHAVLERLRRRHILRRLELAGVHAEIAVRRLEQPFELAKRQRVVGREGAQDPQAHALVNQAVELRRRRAAALRFQRPLGFVAPRRRAGLSHRSAAR